MAKEQSALKKEEMRFKRPTPEETSMAIGDTSSLSLAEQAAYTVDANAYTVLPKRPPAGNWLAQHEETGQSFKSFARRSFRCSPHGHCDTLYIVPIGDFNLARSPPLDDLVGFARAHFAVKVRIMLVPCMSLTAGRCFLQVKVHKPLPGREKEIDGQDR